MKIACLPLLKIMRGVYELPPGQERFQLYIETVTGGSDDIEVPAMDFNPMAKEHLVAKLDALLELGVEEAAEAAASEAEDRLHELSGELITGLELVDDVRGGWSNRHFTEAARRLPPLQRDVDPGKRPFATAHLWASESPTLDGVHAEVLAALYRSLLRRERGLPRTLTDVLRQEGLAGKFARLEPHLPPAEIAAARERMTRFLDSRHYPDIFGCMYGDEAAESVGYPALGFPPRAGYAVALAVARTVGDPVEELLGA